LQRPWSGLRNAFPLKAYTGTRSGCRWPFLAEQSVTAEPEDRDMATAEAGAEEVADGIVDAPVYGYQPPAAFYATGEPPADAIFDIRDFGAVADPGVDNQPMIQAAIEAAHEAGGGVVYIPPGTWGIAAHPDGYGSIHVLDNVFLKGAGMGVSELRLVDGSEGDITGLVRSQWGVETSNWGLADFTIDGNKENTTGKVDGFFTGPQPGSTLTDKDIQVLRIEIENVSRYGFDPHERTERLSIADSVAHDNGVDGFVLDFNIDAELTGNVSYHNGRHGFNFVTTAQDILATGNISYDNGGAGFVVQRGTENIEGPHGITFVGGASYGNGREGVLIQLSDDITVSGMEIYDNGFSGVRVYGSSNVTIDGNTIRDNSQSRHDGYSEIDISSYDDEVFGILHEAGNNLLQNNVISSTGTVMARYGIEERAGGTAANIVTGNEITGTVRGPLALNGSDSYLSKPGTDADDTIIGGSAGDHVTGGHGDDALSGGDSDDLLDGGTGHDTLLGGKGDDDLYGGDGDDVLRGNSGRDLIDGNDGNDTLSGDAGSDWLRGGNGDDTVLGGSGDDSIVADAGNDHLDGGSGFDTLDFSGIGNGVVVDLAAKTAVGVGTDTVLRFEAVTGTAFDDSLTGDKNVNWLVGGDGNDILRGKGGADTLTGGEGADVFLWASAKDVVIDGHYQGLDTIGDFTAGEDTLSITALIGKQTWADIDEVVLVTDTAKGALLSVNIGGTFQDVALLSGVHGLSASIMHDSGMLLV
jgi:parallel beta-helix repeat protein